MKSYAKLTRLGLIFLAAPLLASCQTKSSPSYSGTVERTAAEIEAEVTDRICTALVPEKVSREGYDASPEDVQDALAKGAAAWVKTCQQK